MSTAPHATPSASKPGVGDFVWHELRTTDAAAAQDFYTHVVGWRAQSSGDPGGMPYTLLAAGETATAGLMQLSPSMLAEGMRPAWVGFVGVDDVDAYARQLEGAGGKLHRPPMDIPGTGRFASVEDPQGAAFLLFRGSLTERPPQPPFGTTGTVGWNELSTDDAAAAWLWYAQLFGWVESGTLDMGPMGTYRMFGNGGSATGAIMTRNPDLSPVPFWLYYINVDEINAAASRIREKHGEVLMGPHEVPGPLWIVIGKDPQGAVFALVSSRNE